MCNLITQMEIKYFYPIITAQHRVDNDSLLKTYLITNNLQSHLEQEWKVWLSVSKTETIQNKMKYQDMSLSFLILQILMVMSCSFNPIYIVQF